VSILKLRGGVFEVLATNGDTRLGGDDMDERLAMLLLGELPAEVGSRPEVRARARAAAERAKRVLSDERSAEMILSLPGRAPVRRAVTRAEFGDLIREMVQRRVTRCRRALKAAALDPADVREVVAVGGATRVPLVRRTMQELFQRPPLVDLDPEEVVALGAGIQAGILGGS